MLLATFWVQFKPVRADAEAIMVPDDHPTIQQAINIADEGDTVFVRSGIYFEHVVVNKSIWLIGESRDTTIIDGGGIGTVVRIEKADVYASELAIRNAGYISPWRDYSGIRLDMVVNCTIENVSVTNCAAGISMSNSSHISIYNNSISSNHFGIVIQASHGIIMKGNRLTYNDVILSGYRGANLMVFGDRLSSFIQDIDSSNEADGKPMCYWVGQRDKEVSSGVGYVAIVESTNITVKDLTLQGVLFACTNNSVISDVNISDVSIGIEMLFSNNNRIVNSIISSTDWGLGLVNSHGNSVINNTISKSTYWGVGLGGPNGSNNNLIDGNVISYNSFHGVDIYGVNNTITRNDLSYNRNGVLLDGAGWNNVVGNNILNNSGFGIYLIRNSEGNIIHHNNFVGNTVLASTWTINVWDDGLEGNYWSDYRWDDSNQDGIGDAPYVIDEINQDNYPLMGMSYHFNVTSRYSVTVISNSSVFGFHFNQSSKIVKFNVDGSVGTIGFCRVRIPKALLGNGSYIVTVDGLSPLFLKELTISNSTYEYLYFTYLFTTTHEVLIVPEFSSSAILLFMMVFLSAAAVLNKKKARKNEIKLGVTRF